MSLEEILLCPQQVQHRKGVDAKTKREIAHSQVPIVLPSLNPDLIYNFDETGFFFLQLPTKSLGTLASKERKCWKLAKDRLTVGLFVTSTGADKFSPVVFGTAKKPRCFGQRQPADAGAGVKYFSNKIAWMSSDMFVAMCKCATI